jgi:hypothetical protein
MAKSRERIKQEIKDYIRDCGGAYSDWYVGIASDAKQRLFTDHGVTEKGGVWIYGHCENSEVARDIEDYFVNTLGTKGGPGGGDEDTTFIYAYKTTSDTKE